jgi:hypothetical protein
MATATRKLFPNWFDKTLRVSDKNGAIFSLPDFNKYEVIPLEVVIIEPDLDPSGIFRGLQTFQRVPVANLSLSVSLNDTYDDASPLAYQNTFTKDETVNTFSGSLSLNTAALNTWLGSSEYKTGYFEIEIQEGSNVSKIYRAEVRVHNSVSQVGAVVPSPVDEYYTKAQADAQFLKPISSAGVQVTITSPGGIYQRVFGVTDEGQPIDQILPV